MYAGEAPVDHPEISPVNMDFRGLPPLLMLAVRGLRSLPFGVAPTFAASLCPLRIRS